MRLIDATKLKIDLQENFCKYTITCDECSKMFGEELCDIIDKQTTAYDVDKVVEGLELENKRLKTLKNNCIALSDHEVCGVENKAYGYAIKLVKRGGKDE